MGLGLGCKHRTFDSKPQPWRYTQRPREKERKLEKKKETLGLE